MKETSRATDKKLSGNTTCKRPWVQVPPLGPGERIFMDEILAFINRRFKDNCHWMDGNCYYFAIILKHRFPHLEIVYLAIDGHFMVIDPQTKLLYDFQGVHTEDEMNDKILLFDTIKQEDPSWYGRIIRDCVM